MAMRRSRKPKNAYSSCCARLCDPASARCARNRRRTDLWSCLLRAALRHAMGRVVPFLFAVDLFAVDLCAADHVAADQRRTASARGASLRGVSPTSSGTGSLRRCVSILIDLRRPRRAALDRLQALDRLARRRGVFDDGRGRRRLLHLELADPFFDQQVFLALLLASQPKCLRRSACRTPTRVADDHTAGIRCEPP